jgi:hypothetical protein
MEFATMELRGPEEAAADFDHGSQPFGMLRMRVVEFIAQVFNAKPLFREELMSLGGSSTGLLNTLLFFFDHYPFHNLLHIKVCDIFMAMLNDYSDG